MSHLEFQCHCRLPGGFQIDAAFELDRRFTALFGPSGAGKTTILSIIAGFILPQRGRIRLGDRTLLDTENGINASAQKRSIGMVFQDSLLFPHLTVEGNLRFGQRHRKAQKRAIAFDRVVKVLEIDDLLLRLPRNLSGGEKQRVALGRALLSGPELLLMDEPLASLDAQLKMKILDYLERAILEWDIPCLYVTHSQVEVRRAADAVVVLEKGRVVAVGPPDEALWQPDLLGWSNSTGPINLLRLDRVEISDGQAMGYIGSQCLSLPPRQPPGAAPRFVQFSPANLLLSRQDVRGISARNHLRGRVCRIVPGDRAVFAAIDIGQIIWAEVTPAAAAELELQSGVEIICLLKTHSMSLVD
jgi:molybdate transport system ATP-binding protein